jgi:hypothetical protein
VSVSLNKLGDFKLRAGLSQRRISCVVHHNKIDASMSQLGQQRTFVEASATSAVCHCTKSLRDSPLRG